MMLSRQCRHHRAGAAGSASSSSSRTSAAVRWTRGAASAPVAGRRRSVPKSIRIRGGVVASAVADDSNVPEAHKGLHASLYGDVAAHAAEAAYEPIAGEDDGTALVPVDPFLAKRDGARPPGVFAIHDESGRLQFVGYSRNIVLSVRSLRSRLGSARVASVRAQVVSGRELQSRAALARRAQEWIDSAPGGETPPGNGAEAALWTGAISSGGGSGSSGGSSPLHLSVDAAAMSPAELDAYEQRKTKLRKAMGDKAVMAEAAVAEPTNDERRLRMIAAMERDDWSEVINEQTAGSLPAMAAAVVAAGAVSEGPAGDGGGKTTAPSSSGPTSSPFAQATVHRRVGEGSGSGGSAGGGAGGVGAAAGGGGGGGVEMTRESVLAALEDVRPLLQADGGDIEVVGIEDGVVSVRLEGACSTCAASSATMKMGVERALQAAFGDALRGVVQLSSGAGGASTNAAAVDAHLNAVRPAIAAMGGAVEVVSVGGGVCTLRYKGPPPFAKGVKDAVKERFPDIAEVEIVGF